MLKKYKTVQESHTPCPGEEAPAFSWIARPTRTPRGSGPRSPEGRAAKGEPAPASLAPTPTPCQSALKTSTWTPPSSRAQGLPGLEPITFAGKMHFMPGLARPVFPPWDPGWTHPKFRRLPPLQEHSLYKDEVCYVFHQRCRLLEGVKQALWLTKTKLIEGLPEKVLSLADNPRNHIENQDERVLNVISHARLWHSTEDIPKRETYW